MFDKFKISKYSKFWIWFKNKTKDSYSNRFEEKLISFIYLKINMF